MNAVPPPAASPIADLSYRNYSGPLLTRAARWWTVAVMGIRLACSKYLFWLLCLLALLPHLVLGLMLYIRSQVSSSAGNGSLSGATAPLRYAETFFQAQNGQMFLLFLVALTLGAGAIASDNQANALLVYLARPITRTDYLLGKWACIFLLLFAVAAVPALLMYVFCLLTFWSDGFLRNEPSLLGRVLAAAAVPAAIHASLLTGVSAWFKSGRVAGGFYTALYFLSALVAHAVWSARAQGDFAQDSLLQHLSLQGVVSGIVQSIYQANTRSRFVEVAPPPLGPLLLVGAALSVLGLLAAAYRIRAVEVIRG